MTEEEQFMYDLLVYEYQKTEAEDIAMFEMLLEVEEQGVTEFEDFDYKKEYNEEYIGDMDEIKEKEFVSEYDLDPLFPDDDWLEPFEEWELSPDYGED